MKQISRNISFDDARDLLERVPRACLSFACEHGAHTEPVTLHWRDNRYFVAFPSDAAFHPAASAEVVLLVDEGLYFFNLRAIYIRGHVQPVESTPDQVRYEVAPTKIVAWDYGMMREVNDGDPA